MNVILSFRPISAIQIHFYSVVYSLYLYDIVRSPYPPCVLKFDHGALARYKVRMGSEALPWDIEFRPHEHLSDEDVDLALSPQRMQAVTSDAQVSPRLA